MSIEAIDMGRLARQHESLRHLAWVLVGDEHGADDVAQDAWVRALERGPRDPKALAAWLGTVARRIASNLRRSSARRAARERGAARDEALPSSAEIAARVELGARVLAALEALEEPHRTALRDRYLGELTPAQIARRDGVPIDTIKSRLSRARTALREKLDREGLGGDVDRDVHWRRAVLPLLLPAATHVPIDASHPASFDVPHAAPLDVPHAAPLDVSHATSAASAAFPVGSVPVAGAVFGGTLVMKKILAIACALVLGVVGWRVVRPPAGTPPAPLGFADPIVDASGELRDAPAGSAEVAAHTPADRTPVAPASHTDRAAWSIHGRARQPSRAGAGGSSGVSLSFTVHAGYDTSGEVLHREEVATGVDGRFAFELEDPRRTVTIVVASEPTPARKVVTYGPYVAVLGEGPPEAIDVLVFPIDARMDGTVRDAGGDPIRGCRVEGLYGNAETDAHGRYDMAIASSSWGQVIASAAGFGSQSRVLENLSAGVTTTVDFVLGPGASITGIVRDRDGRAIAGAEVAAYTSTRHTASSDAGGHYLITGIGHEPGRSVWVNVAKHGFGSASGTVELRADRTSERLDFALEPGVPVSGRVLDPSGRAVRGAEVWIGRDRHAWGVSTTRSDDDGHFAFAAVAPGRTVLGAEKPGFAASDSVIEVAGAGASGVLLQLAVARAVRGVVQDATGAPIAGVGIAARRGHDYVGGRASTGATGAFELGDLPDGELAIEAFHRGLVRTEVPVGARQTDVTVVMQRAGRLRGRVVDAASGAPLRTFTVRFVAPADRDATPRMGGYAAVWGQPGKTFDSPDGTWSTGEFDELLPGAWTGVEVSADGFAPRLLPQVAVAGPDDDSVLVHELVAPVAVDVSVVIAVAGTPVADADIEASSLQQPQDGDARWNARTDARGIARLDGVAPGPLWVCVRRVDGVAIVRGPFEVAGDGAARAFVAVEVPGGTALEVVLLDADGAPLAGRGVRVTALEVEGVRHDRLEGTSDAAGRCRFDALPPGVWQVSRVRRDGGHDCFDLTSRAKLDAGVPSTRHELREPGRTMLRGRVDAVGALPEGTQVSVLSRAGGPSHAGLVRDGAFEVRGIGPGDYSVTVMYFAGSVMMLGHAEVRIGPTEREVEVTLTPQERRRHER